MKEVFLSYRSTDYKKAYAIKEALEAENISVWMAPSDIPAGSSYGAEIPQAIESCTVFLLILSSAAQTSKWIPKEIDRAINEGKKIIPYMIEKCNINREFGFFLSNIQIKEAYKNEETVFFEILKEIQAVTRKTPLASLEKEYKANIERNNCPQSIIVQSYDKGTLFRIHPQEILYVVIENRKSVLYLIDKKIETNYPLSYWIDILNGQAFAQPHYAYIVNLNYVYEVTKDFVKLKYDTKEYCVYTSVRRIKAFKNALSAFYSNTHNDNE